MGARLSPGPFFFSILPATPARPQPSVRLNVTIPQCMCACCSSGCSRNWWAARPTKPMFRREPPRMRELAGSIVVARNREFAEISTPLAEGDEVAFLPPVSGGACAISHIAEAGHYFALTRHAIDTRALAARLLTGAEGAMVTFEGKVRNHTGGRATLCLDYECYEPMALKMMAQIGLGLAAGREIERIAMMHRLGRMLIGDTSVVILVTAAHRRPAFEAALEAIDQLK